MKRSKFEKLFAEEWDRRDPVGPAEDAGVAARLAEQAGVAWDPEEPEERYLAYYPEDRDLNAETRFTAEWGWEHMAGGRWRKHPQDLTPVYQELGRRLLAEAQEREKLDEHNDKLEEDVDLKRLLEEETEGVAILGDLQFRVGRLEEWTENVEANLQGLLHAGNKESSRLDSLERQVGDHDAILSRLDTASADYKALGERLASLEQKYKRTSSLLASDGKTLNDHAALIQQLEHRLLLVEGQASHVDHREAADYEATRRTLDLIVGWLGEVRSFPGLRIPTPPAELFEGELPSPPLDDMPFLRVERRRYEQLAALWDLWGPDGELRKRLAEADLGGREWLQRFRSELLALPDELKEEVKS